jgi:hypothetical protein
MEIYFFNKLLTQVENFYGGHIFIKLIYGLLLRHKFMMQVWIKRWQIFTQNSFLFGFI